MHSSGNNLGFSTDFRVGWGLSDRWLVYYDNKVNYINFSSEGMEGDGVNSAAVSYYFRDTHPSAYLTGGIGVAARTFLEYGGGSSGYNGFGLFGGGGYEMSKRSSVEGTISYGRPTAEELFGKLTTNSLGFRAQMVFQWF